MYLDILTELEFYIIGVFKYEGALYQWRPKVWNEPCWTMLYQN